MLISLFLNCISIYIFTAPSLPPDLSSYIRQYNYTPVGESKAKVQIYLNLPIKVSEILQTI